MVALRALLIALFTFATVVPADAFRWPWDAPRRAGHRHSHKPAPPAVPLPPPNCTAVLEAYRALDAEHLARALRDSTPKQRAVIDKCLKEGGSNDNGGE